MCKWGEEVVLDVTVAAENSHTGEAYTRPFGIDACIAPIVRALNAGGITTTQSCCGHGAGPGEIVLADGRVLTISGVPSSVVLAVDCSRSSPQAVDSLEVTKSLARDHILEYLALQKP